MTRATCDAAWGGLLVALALMAVSGVGAFAQGWELRVCAGSDNLPFSNDEEEGFENRVAELLADELGADLTYVWLERPGPQARQLLIEQGACDVLMGVTEGHPELLATLAYYRSSYMFVYRHDAEFQLQSFDDPVLRELRIGVQAGANGISPAVYALANRDLIDNQVTFVADYRKPEPLAEIVEAVAADRVDVAVVWGPVAGYFTEQQQVALELVPVSPQIELPFVPMVSPISIGVRTGDEALRDSLNTALARRWDEVQEILARYLVPLEPLPQPNLEVGTP